MIGFFWSIDIVISIISAVIMAVVFAFYARRYSEFRSKLAMGLVIFSGAFLIQSILSSYIYYVLAQTYTSAVAIPIMVIMLLELAGLLSLIYIVEQ
ncbi:MAG: hypothetical protein JRN26_02315 [Nitrososphaerota archaeon]|jgi:hypothetical protein|nr:hypothetical protein [Nitrososphaerota archaeon]MDG6930276.1 hypothetical protein [Nitrososphaerota archaeon]MDG6932979.1 hypothetical protein [Nitrososphaerota archaeon]MDG6935711.1 hypothetical protein [Nitrososphaerota archaeon]MDG6943551.1 hypothetical protein [Nitrososphaerota archaeon]